MINRFFGICGLILCGLASADAALVAQWNFNSGTTFPVSASSQDSNLGATPTLATSGGLAAATLTGALLQYDTQNGNHADEINGTVVTLTIDAGNASYSTFSAAYNVDNIGFTTLNGQWTFAINGGGFSTVAGAPLEALITDGAQSDTLGGIALSAGDVLQLRFTLQDGAGANSSDITFDDFTINAGSITPVPEPANVALGFFALIAVAVSIGRRVLNTRKA